MKYIGAHFGISDGFSHCVSKANDFGATAFALFTKPTTQWKAKIITEDASDAFKANCERLSYPSDRILAHASYLINMGNPDELKRKSARHGLTEEMKRCKQLGVTMLNFHPGSHLKGNINKSIKDIGKCVHEAIDKVPGVMLIFETMAGSGSNIGGKLEHIRDLIAASDYEDKVGVCIDTCHTFCAGYDIRTEEKWNEFMEKFDKVIGLKYLKGMHLNDSKNPFDSKKDRHESIGKGYIGIDAFKAIVKDPRTDNIPMILETPDANLWRQEIELLKSFA